MATHYDVEVVGITVSKEQAKLTAEDLMSKDPVAADVETPVIDIVKIMKEKNVIRLPITSEGKLVGMVARCDVLTRIIEHVSIADKNVF
jgi:predicted transcriptional regulator